MATSSIIEDIRVNNPKAIEDYVEAMETSAQDFRPRTPDEQSTVVSDPERIKNFVQRCLAKRGKKN